MARIGKKPVPIPAGVTVEINKNEVMVKGPKGQLSQIFSPDMAIKLDNGAVAVSRPSEQRHHKAMHGLTRALINNMIIGVSAGFTSELEVVGVGYRARIEGKDLILNVGYSHPVVFEGSEQIAFGVDNTGRMITIRGIDKAAVGETAARVRRTRPPEPYKGKGIQYKGEVIRRKAGKAGAK